MPLYDVTGIGNAIVDVLCPCDEQFLVDYNITKGSMTLIDEDRAKELYDAMKGQATETSGGCAANTMAGIASFGGKGAFIGLVANDELGHSFTIGMQDTGITYNTSPYIQGLETARSFIFITPDGERSMNTFLGACTELSVEHVNSFLISNSSITHMEGYLFDKDPAKEAYYMASKIAHDNERKVSLTLSDGRCVQRHQKDFQHLVENSIDIVFANEPELCALYDTDDIDEAFEKAISHCEVVVSTRGNKGARIAIKGESLFCPSVPDIQVKDLTGAGDQFGAGFLYGYTQGFDLEKCGLLANKAAAEVITHIGPRPHMDYKDFLDE